MNIPTTTHNGNVIKKPNTHSPMLRQLASPLPKTQPEIDSSVDAVKKTASNPSEKIKMKIQAQEQTNSLIPGMIEMMQINARLNITAESFQPYPGSPICKGDSYMMKKSMTQKRFKIGNRTLGRRKYTSKCTNNCESTVFRPEGRLITAEHEQYALTYGMMMGILNSVGSNNQFNTRLSMNDFMKVDKKLFLYRADDITNTSMKHAFKFKDYSPDIFRQIRRRFNIDSADYMLTLCGDSNYIEFLSNSKSGQFFFYSQDGSFMIKTQTKSESKFLRRMLPHYYKFVMENPNTLITRFYGMHRVKMQHLRKQMHFVIMASVFNTPKKLHMKFDLKGSTLGREANKDEKEKNGVLKDMDLIRGNIQVFISPTHRKQLLDQTQKDVNFLKEMKIVDYSMLIGIHDSSIKNEGNEDCDHSSGNLRNERYVSDTTCKFDLEIQEPESTLTRSMSLPDLTSIDFQDDLDETEFFVDGKNKTKESDDSTEDLVVPTVSPLSPRLFDQNMHPFPAQSIFCKDYGGLHGYKEMMTGKREVIYFMGIIDILQQYNSKKIAEAFFKSLLHDRAEISAVDPELYAQRFIKFLDEKVLAKTTLISQNR